MTEQIARDILTNAGTVVKAKDIYIPKTVKLTKSENDALNYLMDEYGYGFDFTF